MTSSEFHQSTDMVLPGGTIGILGGGQLGRMLAMAAAELGLKTHIYAPEGDCPAAEVATHYTAGAFDDVSCLQEFAKSVDVITLEFENVPVTAVKALIEDGQFVRPGPTALEIAQDRLKEKDFINKIGAATAPYHSVENIADLQAGLDKIGRPAILKTRRLGYDGKGQTRVTDNDIDLQGTYEKAIEFAWAEVGANPSILEGFIPFVKEISVLGARAVDGTVRFYDCPENVHQNGILKRSSIPADVGADVVREAHRITNLILTALGYIGVIGVEFFVLKNGDLIVNEFAPRVHNSGHWTQDACAISQFEQHIRAVAGWPLGDPARHSNAVMTNLIGHDVDAWQDLAGQPATRLHIYGKDAVREGRKMGHATKIIAK